MIKGGVLCFAAAFLAAFGGVNGLDECKFFANPTSCSACVEQKSSIIGRFFTKKHSGNLGVREGPGRSGSVCRDSQGRAGESQENRGKPGRGPELLGELQSVLE